MLCCGKGSDEVEIAACHKNTEFWIAEEAFPQAVHHIGVAETLMFPLSVDIEAQDFVARPIDFAFEFIAEIRMEDSGEGNFA
jgi:hypothetical protein